VSEAEWERQRQAQAAPDGRSQPATNYYGPGDAITVVSELRQLVNDAGRKHGIFVKGIMRSINKVFDDYLDRLAEEQK
jgi:hypothetical protein